MSFAYQFWKRIDALRGNTSLKDLSEKVGIKYQRIKEQRSSGRIPNADDLFRLSQTLGTSVEYLLTGKNQQVYICPEAKAVNEDPELQALVRAIMKDRRLLSALASVITSMENTSEGLA